DVRNKIGLNAGILYTYSNYVHFGFGAGLGFSGEGVIVKSRGVDTKTSLNYVRVPLRLYYFLNHLENPFRPKIYVGPSFGFLTKATVKTDGLSTDASDFIENFDLGLQVGTGFNYKFAPRSWFTFDLNYTHGLTTLVKVGDNRFNRNVGVTMGLAWGF
ncbi:MAG: porin family protein, partial [Saprospiraceae bacterium]